MFKIGDKVKIPTTKSTGSPLSMSMVVKKAKADNQDFLYVVDIISKDYIYVLSNIDNTRTGDWFTVTDLTKHEEIKVKRTRTSKVKVKEEKQTIQVLPLNTPATNVVETIGDEVHRIIVNNPAIIYVITDKATGKSFRGVAKCLPDDKFDLDKGRQISFTKAKIKQLKRELKDLSK